MMSESHNQDPYGGMIAIAQTVNSNLQNIYNSDLNQVRQWLYSTLGAGIFAFLALLLILFLISKGQAPGGLGAAGFHLLTDGFTIFFARQLIAANRSVTSDRDKLSQLQGIILAFQGTQMLSEEVRDHYRGLLIVQLSGLAKGQQIAALDLLAKEQITLQNQVVAQSKRRNS